MNNTRVSMPKGELVPIASTRKWLTFGVDDAGETIFVGETCSRQHAYDLYVKTFPDDKDLCLNCGS